MTAAARPLHALVRHTRSAMRLAGVALDRRRELGFAELVRRGVARTRAAAELSPQPAPGAVFDVIYAIGYRDGEPQRYRVYNLAEGLGAAGYAVHVLPFDRLGDIVRFGWRAAALVLFRAEYDRFAGIDEALTGALRAGMRVVYDIDDLVFDPTLADRIDGLRLLGPHRRRLEIAAMARRRRMIGRCDLVTASTAPLARAAAALGPEAAVIPNSLNQAQLSLAGELAGRKRTPREGVTIGYFSGTRTHQRDFAVCEPALLDLLERRPELRLRLVGHLDLGAHWRRFERRVERIGLLSPAELLRAIAETDINLAPLELGNPFCEAKSELKFFEAGAVGVPTVASATEVFAAAIEDGTSGLLARDDAGWRAALDLLAGSAERRTAIGEAARASAVARYGIAAVTKQAVAALGLRAPA
jgi:glycosyltransferase involved in cell wall biosynthesis